MRLRRPAPRGEPRQQIDAACWFAPTRPTPIVGGDDHDIDQFAAFDRIMDEMGVAPEPQMHERLAELGRKLRRWYERAPSGAAGKSWRGFWRDACPRR